ncbi:MAG: sugar transferase, partial [Chloroflexota bacterium]
MHKLSSPNATVIPKHKSNIWSGALYSLTASVIGWLMWISTSHFGRWNILGGLVFLGGYGALAFCLVKISQALPMRSAWAYRAAFMGSSGILLAHWLVSLLFQQTVKPGWISMALPGIFLGCLLASSQQYGLWENNFPPSEIVCAEVLHQHQIWLGSLPPTPFLKRTFDFSLAFLGLILSTPIWLLSAWLLWMEDPGTLLFVKNSVGRGGINFHQFKFRTMIRNAEDQSGPRLADERDKRTLRVGHFLRKTALDELPQLLNILRGEMSFVGPRPQRTVLVHQYLPTLPAYAERHRVLPGLSGLAQVMGSYYISPQQKLRLDRIYVRHASLGFDLKLIILAFLVVFYLRWKKNWNGRIP